MNKELCILSASQAIMMSTVTLTISTSALIGSKLTTPELATFPIAAQYAGTMLLLYPTALLMKIISRPKLFAAGAIIGGVGLFLCALGIFYSNINIFILGSVLVGAFNASGQYYRFAAVDTVRQDQRSIAISLTLAGGIIAAFFGPFLANWAGSISTPPFFISYSILSCLVLLSALLFRGTTLPSPHTLAIDTIQTQSLKKTQLITLIIPGALGYVIMNMLMIATPLAMIHDGHDFSSTSHVIQWHIAAMFIPSLFTGSMIKKWGAPKVIQLGCTLYFLTCAINATSISLPSYTTSLILLGVGWNFIFISSTTLLTSKNQLPSPEKLQAVNDTLIFSGIALSAFLTAPILEWVGWRALNISMIPLTLLVILTTISPHHITSYWSCKL